MATTQQVFYAQQAPAVLADLVTTARVVNGAAAAGVVAVDIPTDVVAVLAITKATGAVASKFLLAKTTDYTINANKKGLTMVTDQSANTLIVIVK